ncbi:hypothetical protein ASG39_04535 [Rhizobium sp. Leaf371]|nr:hypothetical protein ASG39_04535 [Rhizobium sp. Leaf371]
MGKLRFHEILELGTSDTNRATGCGDERAAGRRKDVPLLAICDDEPLTIQFHVEGCASLSKGCLQFRPIEALVFTLGALAGDV